MRKKISIRFRHDNYDLWTVAGIMAFPIIALIIAPIIHEYAHVFVLKLYGCSSWTSFNFSFMEGITAAIHHSCELSLRQTLIFNLAGLGATLAIAFIILIADWFLTKKDCLEYSIFTTFIGTGFFFSFVTYFFKTEGDIVESLNMLGINYTMLQLYAVGILFIVICLAYLALNVKEILKDLKKDRLLFRKKWKTSHNKHKIKDYKKYKRPESPYEKGTKKKQANLMKKIKEKSKYFKKDKRNERKKQKKQKIAHNVHKTKEYEKYKRPKKPGKKLRTKNKK